MSLYNNKNINIYLILYLNVFYSYNCQYIHSRCGYPGLPHNTRIDPKKTDYQDGDEVTYSCPYDKLYSKTQTMRCMSGVWVGTRSTCGHYIKNQLISVKVINLLNNSTVVDMNTSVNSNSAYPVLYYDGKGAAVQVPEPHVLYKWRK